MTGDGCVFSKRDNGHMGFTEIEFTYEIKAGKRARFAASATLFQDDFGNLDSKDFSMGFVEVVEGEWNRADFSRLLYIWRDIENEAWDHLCDEARRAA
jgi:hypothetical protein